MSKFQILYPDDEFFKKDIKIIDIRTKGEWIDTGIVKGSYAITFFDDYGKYDLDNFLKQLDDIVDKDKEFALICATGNRTSMVGEMLSSNFGYKTISLNGGIYFVINNLNVPIVKYKG